MVSLMEKCIHLDGGSSFGHRDAHAQSDPARHFRRRHRRAQDVAPNLVGLNEGGGQIAAGRIIRNPSPPLGPTHNPKFHLQPHKLRPQPDIADE
jgi:hypothetical protein